MAAVAPTREQRKTVTVLQCDVTGSTALGEQLDPESLRGALARYFEAAKKVIERHGGVVEKFIGDAVLAVFGVPVVHEDDALRAVRAAAGNRTGTQPGSAPARRTRAKAGRSRPSAAYRSLTQLQRPAADAVGHEHYIASR